MPPTFVHSPFQTLRIKGQDTVSWLNGMVTCDVSSVSPGRATWGLLLTKQGKIQAELRILGESTNLLLAVSGGNRDDVAATLDHHLVMEDVELTPEDEWTWLQVLGEGTTELLSRLSGLGEYLVGSLDYGQEGHLIAVPNSTIPTWKRQLRKEGVEMELSLGDQVRVDQGLPIFGQDYSERDNPHEASLDRRAVSWKKGCYLGQEVVCMQDMRGKVKRRLVRVVAEEPSASLIRGTVLVSAEGEDVATVTTASGHRAIVSCKAPHFEPNTALFAAGRRYVVEPL